MTFSGFLETQLASRRDADLFRSRHIVDSAQGARVFCDDRWLHNFSSNDYLGLAAHPAIAQTAARAAREGVGSGASHLVSGHHRFHHELEEALAARTGRPAALLFSTGFAANTGTLAALVERGDLVVQDKLNHASLLDGARLSGAAFSRFRHNDIAHLDERLAGTSARRRVVAVDGVFSMDGDIAPLDEISKVCARRDAWLMVDDAHGFGWMGATGGGLCQSLGLGVSEVPIMMGTLGKALGSYGAFVAGSRDLIDYLVQFARPYIYSTAMPPMVAAASIKALELLDTEAWRRDQLREHIAFFRAGAAERHLPLMASSTPIQPLQVGSSAAVMALGQSLRSRGFWVGAIRPPTVPQGSARLRITLTASHTQAAITELLDVLAEEWSTLVSHSNNEAADA